MSDTSPLPVLTVAVDRLAASCPNCHVSHVKWPLGVHAGRLYVTCPRCHVNVAQLAATEPEPASDKAAGCSCCQVYSYPERDPDEECARCDHRYGRHDGQEITVYRT